MSSQPPEPRQPPPVEVVPESPYINPQGQQLPQAPQYQNDMGDDAGMRMLLPVGRSMYAIAAGYLGLVSVIPIFAPFALLLGVLAVKDINRSKTSPHPKHGMGRAVFGIVMGTLGTVALFVLVMPLIIGGLAK